MIFWERSGSLVSGDDIPSPAILHKPKGANLPGVGVGGVQGQGRAFQPLPMRQSSGSDTLLPNDQAIPPSPEKDMTRYGAKIKCTYPSQSRPHTGEAGHAYRVSKPDHRDGLWGGEVNPKEGSC